MIPSERQIVKAIWMNETIYLCFFNCICRIKIEDCSKQQTYCSRLKFDGSSFGQTKIKDFITSEVSSHIYTDKYTKIQIHKKVDSIQTFKKQNVILHPNNRSRSRFTVVQCECKRWVSKLLPKLPNCARNF